MSNFMESFNTGIRLPPVMANITRRVEDLEGARNTTDISKTSERNMSEQKEVTVDSLIETVDEPMIKNCPYREKIEHSVREVNAEIAQLKDSIASKNKTITELNRIVIQLNETLEETINRVHSLEKKLNEIPTNSPSTVDKGSEHINTAEFVTKKELLATEKRIVKELTDKIDAEMIDAEERFDEKIKASTDAIKMALDETIGDDEEDEEEDVDGVIDMD